LYVTTLKNAFQVYGIKNCITFVTLCYKQENPNFRPKIAAFLFHNGSGLPTADRPNVSPLGTSFCASALEPPVLATLYTHTRSRLTQIYEIERILVGEGLVAPANGRDLSRPYVADARASTRIYLLMSIRRLVRFSGKLKASGDFPESHYLF
jgi:hypothetical protein